MRRRAAWRERLQSGAPTSPRLGDWVSNRLRSELERLNGGPVEAAGGLSGAPAEAGDTSPAHPPPKRRKSGPKPTLGPALRVTFWIEQAVLERVNARAAQTGASQGRTLRELLELGLDEIAPRRGAKR